MKTAVEYIAIANLCLMCHNGVEQAHEIDMEKLAEKLTKGEIDHFVQMCTGTPIQIQFIQDQYYAIEYRKPDVRELPIMIFRNDKDQIIAMYNLEDDSIMWRKEG